jgi:hypothetical protein
MALYRQLKTLGNQASDEQVFFTITAGNQSGLEEVPVQHRSAEGAYAYLIR